MKYIVRGAFVPFSSTFKDVNGNILTPTTATLLVTYNIQGVPTTDTLAMMAQADGSWFAEWNSAYADAGLVQWFIDTGGTASVATEGSFVLKANAANPQLPKA